MSPMTVRGTCSTCRRVFELPPELATSGRTCQYCGSQLIMSTTMADATPTAGIVRREPTMGNCPVCDQQNRFEVGVRMVACARCKTEIMEPERAGMLARIAQPAITGKNPPITVPCAHCGGRGKMEVDAPNPDVRCERCQKPLTAAYLPLEKWADVRGLAQPGSLADSLMFILRSRWNAGTVAPAEVLRHVSELRTVVDWLQRDAKERKSDFPLGVEATAGILQYFILRVDKCEVQSQSSDRCILVVPTKRDEPREHDTKFMKIADLQKPRVPPAMILSIGAVPTGSVFGFLARSPDGTTGALAQERLDEVQQLIARDIPRACFRYLAYRFMFGEHMRPPTMVFVLPSIVERELRKLSMTMDKIKAIQERLG